MGCRHGCLLVPPPLHGSPCAGVFGCVGAAELPLPSGAGCVRPVECCPSLNVRGRAAVVFLLSGSKCRSWRREGGRQAGGCRLLVILGKR